MFKRFFAYFSLLLVGLFINACANRPSTNSNINVMTYNIRCGNCEKIDDINHWSKRVSRINSIIEKYHPDILALQEAEGFQISDILKANSQYAAYGIGREAGENGERNAILWNEARFYPLSTQTIWLNPTKQKFAIGWDAKYRRTLTMIEFKDRITQKEFWIFNTHLDNEGEFARSESAKIIIDEIYKRARKPIILMGDFNEQPNGTVHKLLSSKLNDAIIHQANISTFNGFGNESSKTNKIDYILASKTIKFQKSQIIFDRINGLYASDHYPILSSIEFK